MTTKAKPRPTSPCASQFEHHRCQCRAPRRGDCANAQMAAPNQGGSDGDLARDLAKMLLDAAELAEEFKEFEIPLGTG